MIEGIQVFVEAEWSPGSPRTWEEEGETPGWYDARIVQVDILDRDLVLAELADIGEEVGGGVTDAELVKLILPFLDPYDYLPDGPY